MFLRNVVSHKIFTEPHPIVTAVKTSNPTWLYSVFLPQTARVIREKWFHNMKFSF
jgi:hypothetical protein